MTLPSACFPRLDAVAVSAPHYALVARNFGFHCGDRLELGDIRSLANHVVNVERSGVLVITAVDATCRNFEVRDPFFDAANTSVIDAIYSLSVSGLRKPALTPSATLLRSRRYPGRASATRAKRRAVFSIGSLRQKRIFTMHARPFGGWRVFPRRHTPMIHVDVRYPCKPEIFAATYEEVQA